MTQRFDNAETIRDKVTTQAMIAIIWITHQVDRISASLKMDLKWSSLRELGARPHRNGACSGAFSITKIRGKITRACIRERIAESDDVFDESGLARGAGFVV